MLLLSDIHGNQTALKEIRKQVKQKTVINGCALLGDVIDYGMHSNEVVQMLKEMEYPLACNILGNHEYAVLNEDYEAFSSERGRQCARYTRSILNEQTWEYIRNDMGDCGMAEFILDGKRCLAVHGSLADIYWESIQPDQDLTAYQAYDYVFSGHSHIPHCFEKYYMAHDLIHRKKKKTIFINPGSVGQPRNHNPMAQFVILDTVTEEVQFCKVEYDIEKEQQAFSDKVDVFYRDRLSIGV